MNRPTGSQPPQPPIDPATLAQAAWESVTIPPPQIDTNPDLHTEGGTVVGLETWVWATGTTPQTVTVTATAGPTSITITSTSAGLHLSAPDSTTTCTGFGIPWQPGMTEGSSPCTITFHRSSAHRGGTTPVTTTVAYTTNWISTDGATGTLGPITTTSTTDLTVTEIQTINVPNPDNT